MFKELLTPFFGQVVIVGISPEPVTVVGDRRKTHGVTNIEGPDGAKIGVQVTEHDGYRAEGMVEVNGQPETFFLLKTERKPLPGLAGVFLVHENRS